MSIETLPTLNYKHLYSNKKTLIIGVLPPPNGGVSTHVVRLFKLLRTNGYNVDVFDTNNLFKAFKIILLLIKLFFGNYNTIHIHGTNKIILRFLNISKVIRSKRKTILTIHNIRLLENKPDSDSKFFRKTFSKLDILIVVNRMAIQNFLQHEIELPKKTIICPAFIEPPLSDEAKIYPTYPDDLIEFIESHSPIVIANASRLIFYNNEDLYGFDLCVELVVRLRKVFSKLGCIFCLSDESYNLPYIKTTKNQMKELGVEKNFFILGGQRELWPLFRECDLFLRPTNTDGDAISIREALFFNVPVLASDVVDRPASCILFKNRDSNDLFEKSLEILQQKSTDET